MTCGIYFIRSPSNKMYIGSSEKVEQRLYNHFYKLDAGTHNSTRLSAAWVKYEGQGFTSGILEACPPEDLEEREQYWIDVLEPRYNVRTRANSNGGLRKTLDERAAQSAFMKDFLANNPTAREAQIENIAEGSRLSWADPVRKAARVTALKAAWTPEKRAEQSARQKGVDRGEAARTARWSKSGASERQSEVTTKMWDRRGRKVTDEVIQAKVAERGWEFVEVKDGRVTIRCPKHDYTGTPKIPKLIYLGQGCRKCGFEQSSLKQLGRPKKKGET